jgi:hypothetical protein
MMLDELYEFDVFLVWLGFLRFLFLALLVWYVALCECA